MNNIVLRQLFQLSDASSIVDVTVHNNFTLVKYVNDSFQAYIKPPTEGTGLASFAKSGILTILPSPDSLVYKV